MKDRFLAIVAVAIVVALCGIGVVLFGIDEIGRSADTIVWRIPPERS